MLVWPIVYASIAYYLLGREGDPKLLFTASLGAAVMIMWAQVIVGSGFALDKQRVQGTLELLVAAPVPFAVLFAPIMIASAARSGSTGSLVTLVWGRFAVRHPDLDRPPVAFAVACPPCDGRDRPARA